MSSFFITYGRHKLCFGRSVGKPISRSRVMTETVFRNENLCPRAYAGMAENEEEGNKKRRVKAIKRKAASCDPFGRVRGK